MCDKLLVHATHRQYGQNEETGGESTNFRNSQLILATVPKHPRKRSFPSNGHLGSSVPLEPAYKPVKREQVKGKVEEIIIK